MPLYRIRAVHEFDMLVHADDAEDAYEIAEDNCEEEQQNVGGLDLGTPQLIERVEQLTADEQTLLPWNSLARRAKEPDQTCAQLLMAEAAALEKKP